MVRASEQKRADIKARREEWQEQQKTMERERLVFLDESGVNLNMTRRYGRAVGKARINFLRRRGNLAGFWKALEIVF